MSEILGFILIIGLATAPVGIMVWLNNKWEERK